jgi:hypothetical protein
MIRTPTVLCVAGLLALGCASVPVPTGEVAQADLAVNKAEAVNASAVAPLDMRLAREKLEKAKLDVKEGKNEEARRLAETAEADALVAEAKARSTRAQQATQELQQQVDALRSGSGAGSAK